MSNDRTVSFGMGVVRLVDNNVAKLISPKSVQMSCHCLEGAEKNWSVSSLTRAVEKSIITWVAPDNLVKCSP